jgi:hypothetical protein
LLLLLLLLPPFFFLSLPKFLSFQFFQPLFLVLYVTIVTITCFYSIWLLGLEKKKAFYFLSHGCKKSH